MLDKPNNFVLRSQNVNIYEHGSVVKSRCSWCSSPNQTSHRFSSDIIATLRQHSCDLTAHCFFFWYLKPPEFQFQKTDKQKHQKLYTNKKPKSPAGVACLVRLTSGSAKSKTCLSATSISPGKVRWVASAQFRHWTYLVDSEWFWCFIDFPMTSSSIPKDLWCQIPPTIRFIMDKSYQLSIFITHGLHEWRCQWCPNANHPGCYWPYVRMVASVLAE